MASKIKVDQIEGQSGTSIEVPTGHTLKITDHGNNKIITTNSSGVLTPVTIGSAGHSLKVNSSANGFEFGSVGGGGKVLQAQIGSATSNYTTTSNSFVYVSGMPSVNITPSATTSNILLMFSGGACEMNGGNGYVTIYRDSTDIGNSTYGFWNVQHNANRREGGAHGVFIDTPSTTSQITYQLRMRNSASSTIGFGESSKSSIIAIEIGA